MEGKVRTFKVYWTDRYLGTVTGATYEACLEKAKDLGRKHGYSRDDHFILMEVR